MAALTALQRELLDALSEKYGLTRVEHAGFDAPLLVVPVPEPDALSGREIEVLALCADGYTNPEIGERLGISTETVKSHVRHLLGKLGARSRCHAVSIGYRAGLLDLSGG